MTEFFGKYRGTVTANDDPEGRGRVRVSVPAILGTDGWAEACTPYAGNGVGLFAVPPVGASVWVEFEAGDPCLPILAGCFWGNKGEAPGPASPATKVLKTDAITLTLADDPNGGGLTIEVDSPAVPTPMRLACTADGIELRIGASRLVLSASSVSINDGALEVI